MKTLAVVLGALLVTGCGSKAVVQPWKDAVDAKPAHDRDVCLMDKPLPASVESELLGRSVANQQSYGGFAAVKAAMANISRQSGADVVADVHYKQKIGFFAVVRPQVWGYAYSLKDPAAFDCNAEGGQLYGFSGPSTAVPVARRTESAQPSSEYDQCMHRVLRIQDEQLRLRGMETCDGV